MVDIFLYPRTTKSPHHVHLTWANSVDCVPYSTPMPFGYFDLSSVPRSELIIIESLYSLPYAILLKRRDRSKIISIVADTSFWDKKLSMGRKIFLRALLRYVDGFVAVSERIEKDIRRFSEKPVEVVRPFPVNVYPKERRQLNKNILFIGNEAKEKGFNKLIDAMRYLKDFNLYLVGTCYKSVIGDVPKNVFVEGRVKSLKKYFERCSFYVHPADFDPCPVVVWEAMLSGLITVISRGTGQYEIFLRDGLSRFVLQSTDPIEISRKIRQIYNNINYTQSVKKMRKVASKYDRDRSIKEFKHAIERLLSD